MSAEGAPAGGEAASDNGKLPGPVAFILEVVKPVPVFIPVIGGSIVKGEDAGHDEHHGDEPHDTGEHHGDAGHAAPGHTDAAHHPTDGAHPEKHDDKPHDPHDTHAAEGGDPAHANDNAEHPPTAAHSKKVA